MGEPEDAHHFRSEVRFDLNWPAFHPRFTECPDQEVYPGAVDELQS
jgi:hypothetical protein